MSYEGIRRRNGSERSAIEKWDDKLQMGKLYRQRTQISFAEMCKILNKSAINYSSSRDTSSDFISVWSRKLSLWKFNQFRIRTQFIGNFRFITSTRMQSPLLSEGVELQLAIATTEWSILQWIINRVSGLRWIILEQHSLHFNDECRWQ